MCDVVVFLLCGSNKDTSLEATVDTQIPVEGKKICLTSTHTPNIKIYIVCTYKLNINLYISSKVKSDREGEQGSNWFHVYLVNWSNNVVILHFIELQ